MKRLIHLKTYQIVVAFILLDMLATLCYSLYQNDLLHSRFFNLGRDRGFFEIIEYAKMGMIISIFLAVWRGTQARLMKAWATLFIVLLVDNAVGLHEEFGKVLDNAVALPTFGLERSKDVAELLFIGLIEGGAFLYLLWNYFHSSADYRRLSNHLIFLFVFIGAGFVGLDAIHSRFEEPFEVLSMTFLIGFIHFKFGGMAIDSTDQVSDPSSGPPV